MSVLRGKKIPITVERMRKKFAGVCLCPFVMPAMTRKKFLIIVEMEQKNFESLSLKFRHARDDGKNFQGMLTCCHIRDHVEGVGADRSRVRNDLAKYTIF